MPDADTFDPATAGEDYQETHKRIVFLPGETSAAVEIPTFTDALEEFDEYFLITLGGGQHARLAMPDHAKGIIVDVQTAKTYDSGGRVTKETLPGGAEREYGYDGQ